MGSDGERKKENKRLPDCFKAANLFLRSCPIGMTGVLYGVGGGGEGKDHLSVYERVNSLFEANYEEAHGCSQAGRTTWAGVSVLVP
jgi:hypothetical protein